MNEKQLKQKSGSAGWQKFRQSAGATLSKLSKAFLLPIALLPIAGVFLGVGATIQANTAELSGIWYLGSVMNKMGDVCFGNLPILFAISVAIAYTEDSGVAAITAVVGFLVMNGIQAALITPEYAEGSAEIASYKMLWWKGIPTALITANVGITSLNTGVFAAIFVGAIAAVMYNKFHKTQLPSFISFFSGSKLVPIVTFVAVIPLSFVFLFIWPGVGLGLNWFGVNSGKLPFGTDSLVYEIIERSLVPFGLHHVFYAPLWWSAAGGGINDQLVNNFVDAVAKTPDLFEKLGDGIKSDLAALGTTKDNLDALKENLKTVFENNKLWGALGDQTALYAVIAQKTVKFTDLSLMGLNLGRFQSGKFGFMLLALPAGAVAMWLNVPKENRKNVMGIYFSAAFTCFLTGITEPIEFTFLFLAPWLFYGVHMPLASISFWITGLMKVHVGMTVSGGFIDFIVFGLVPWQLGTNAVHVFWIVALMTPAYFFAFYFAVKYADVKVPGREGDGKLFTRADVKAKNSAKGSAKVEEQIAKATKIIEYLGGEANITNVDSCASRLRLTVVDSSLVNKDGIMSLGGTTGIIIKGTSVHVVYGGEQEVIKPHMREILKKQREAKKA
ncbi:PTS system glucose-specific IIBC component [Spiroplasma chinense]|uniref:PTS system glucose-specific IIBC component n=1 Tax=Spiroplasma chinense TaxID=216932 RepID=A0A5B9Y2L5_9MOLU|nr:PTS transporter subunit EIIC [Spiroplasma chinense]QEH61314.1 PTS system glucose-specific IIBC component [Spiroplasma chinense]